LEILDVVIKVIDSKEIEGKKCGVQS